MAMKTITIWKYVIPMLEPTFFLEMPQSAKFLDVQIQGGLPVMWMLVDIEAPKKKVRFKRVGTGWNLSPETWQEEYLGTWQEGLLVWHLFKC